MAVEASQKPSVTTNAAKALRLMGVGKKFGDSVALADVAVEMPAGKFTVLLGPSGCGKSTLLRLISGLDKQSAGQIWLGDDQIDGLSPKARDLSMVFQSYALFPHLNVADNILFGLSVRRMPKAEQAQKLHQVAQMMGLGQLLTRKPAELSGGQQQRVALARAVISERLVCLMDEPLSNLDAKLRAEMRGEIRALQQRLGLTMVYVTHDQVEAMTMADQIVVINNGRVDQVATPRGLYERPQTVFVASFIGTPPMNLLPRKALPSIDAPEGTVTIGIRPEDIAPKGSGQQIEALVRHVEYLGADQLVSLEFKGLTLLLRQFDQALKFEGVQILGLPSHALHFFDAAGQRLANPNEISHSNNLEKQHEIHA